MVRTVNVLVTILLLVVCGSSSSQVHREAHVTGSVRNLEAHETVHSSGSDLAFDWDQCGFCDGYDARLHLEDVDGKREISYNLKSAVTTLRVSDLAPGTAYRFIVKTLASDASNSEISGRSFSPAALNPVQNLVARALSSSSIEIDWDSKYAYGFRVEILLDGTAIHDEKIPEFRNHEALKIDKLNPDTAYLIRVTAFISQRGQESTSEVSSVQVKTLPVELPKLVLSWERKTELKLSWKNPESPRPVAHGLKCTQGSKTIFEADFSGLTDFVALSGINRFKSIKCELHTRFSTEAGFVVGTELIIPEEKSSVTSFTEVLLCGSNHTAHYSANVAKENIRATGWLAVRFSKNHPEVLEFNEVQYRLYQDGEKPSEWTPLPSTQYPELLLRPGALKPSQRYLLQYSFGFRCGSQNSTKLWTKTRSLELPLLPEPVDPVTKFRATESGASWEYGDSSVAPDYFLLTHCAKNKCVSQSVRGAARSVTLGRLNGGLNYEVAIQAVKLRDGQTYASPAEMTSFVAPNSDSLGKVVLKPEIITGSPTVKLVISHENSADPSHGVEYHIDACGKPAPIWEGQEHQHVSNVESSCESSVTKDSSIEVKRRPFTIHEVSVFACYGAFDSSNPVNLTLPIFTQTPSAATELRFLGDQGKLLKWNYDSWKPSGFSISMCPSSTISGDEKDCKSVDTGPGARSHKVDESWLDGKVTLSVTPFVEYEGQRYTGLKADIEVGDSAASPVAA